jgi:hypothetical protein
MTGWALMAGCSVTADTDTGKDSGQDTDDKGDCTGDAVCAIVVENAMLTDCESDSGSIPTMTVTQTGPGALDVAHYSASVGCCPEFSATAELDPSAKTLTMTYSFENDSCDCVCALDLSYSLVDVPAGTWTLKTSNLDQEVTVSGPPS